jgi:uncharacterized protein (UPF0335 family)
MEPGHTPPQAAGKPQAEPLQAGFSSTSFDSAHAPEWIMWMPGGDHTITARQAGKAVTRNIRVDAPGARAVQASLLEHLSGRQRPFFDFDHESKAAAAWPTEFAWRDTPEPGVYARVEWSDQGRAAIAGKTYRAFSPTFFVDEADPAHVVAAPLTMGGLVNNPAFREIKPIWASSAPANANTNPKNSMDELTAKTELAALQSRLAALESENHSLKAAAEDADVLAAIQGKDAQIADLQKQIEAHAKDAADRRNRDAEACVATAVARGAIAAKDTSTQDHWRKLIAGDPSNATLLSKLPSAPAITAGRLTGGSRQVELVSVDTNDVLRAYKAAGTAREKGAIYHRELSKRIASGENVFARWPVEATNTLGTLVNAVVSQRVLELVSSKRPQLRGAILDFSDEVKAKGDTTKTRTIGLPTAADFGGTESATADTDVTVTLDLFKQFAYVFTAAEVVGTSRNLVAERSEALAVAMGNYIVDQLAALITEANFGTSNQTIQASGWDFTTLTTIARKLNVAGVPDTYRFGWVNSTVAEALANDQLVTEYTDKSGVQNAYAAWRNIKGFTDVWEYPALPANSCNLIGYFGSRSGLIVCARVPQNPAELLGVAYDGRIEVVTDPVSGLSVVRNDYVDNNSWGVTTRLVILFGVDVGNAAVGHTLVSAA